MATVAGTPAIRQTQQPASLYDRDRYTWASQQVDALKRRDFDGVDWDNVTGEIEAWVRGEESSLKSQYARIMEHFLKLQYRTAQDAGNVAGWTISINDARQQINDLLEDSPGLAAEQDNLFNEAWKRARRKAIDAFIPQPASGLRNQAGFLRETKRLSREWNQILPDDNPFSRRQAEDRFWLPEPRVLTRRPQSRSDSDTLDWSR